MMEIYRAWYKPDFEKCKKGTIPKFVMKEIDSKLYFVLEDAIEFRYGFEIPFLDEDWILEKELFKDTNEVSIFANDIISYSILVDIAEDYQKFISGFIGYIISDKRVSIGKPNYYKSLSKKLSKIADIKVIGNMYNNEELLKESL